ncbi:MAG TPA: DNA-formamidopyrimidine glycosylase family protein [Candidatus Dormibacteraeota bacterium]
MPEMPEVAALVGFLDRQTKGRRLERVELASFSALKTVAPPLTGLAGQRVQGWTRRGKYLCLHSDLAWLVIHLGRAGWVRWYDGLPATVASPGRGPIALRVGLDGSSPTGAPGFDVTEAGTQKRVSFWLVEDPDRIPALAELGPDPLDPTFSSESLAQLLTNAPGTVKAALTRQSLVAGVGNAYSDEVLHAARISPFQAASKLSPDQVEALHRALVELLGGAVAELANSAAADLKGEKRQAMRVHGQTGNPCPVCGDTIREVAYANRSLQYCPSCQTGGRQLADRRLSRLLK